jgi:hypothetical protein
MGFRCDHERTRSERNETWQRAAASVLRGAPTAIPALPRYGANTGRHRTRKIVIRLMLHETKDAGRAVLQVRKLQAAGRSVAGSVQGVVNKNQRSWLGDAAVVGTAGNHEAREHCDEDIPPHYSIVLCAHIAWSSSPT